MESRRSFPFWPASSEAHQLQVASSSLQLHALALITTGWSSTWSGTVYLKMSHEAQHAPSCPEKDKPHPHWLPHLLRRHPGSRADSQDSQRQETEPPVSIQHKFSRGHITDHLADIKGAVSEALGTKQAERRPPQPPGLPHRENKDDMQNPHRRPLVPRDARIHPDCDEARRFL